MNKQEWLDKLESDKVNRDGIGMLVLDICNEQIAEILAEHDKQIKSELIEEIIDKIMQEDYCDKSCCCDYERDCRVKCAEYHHNVSAIIGMLINMRVKENS